jgi:small-conductance mechanosensitive channel
MALVALPAQLLLIVLMVSLFRQAAAQPAPQPTGKLPLPSLTATPPIAVQNILARADEEQQLVDVARQLLAAPPPIARLQRGLDDIGKPVDVKLRAASGAALRELPIMRLESLARHWDFDAARYARWEAGARRALAPYEDAAVQLAQRRLAWSATRAAGMLDGLPPVIAVRVDAMLEQIDACQAALGTVLAQQFALTERASALKARIRTGSADVAAAIDDIDRRLLRVDVPPLWQGLGTLGSSRASLDAVQRGLEIESRFARDYNAAGTGNQQALRVVQVLLLPLILGLVLRSRRHRPGGAAAANPTSALRRPWSAWVLLSMLAVLLFEPDAPLLVQEVALVLALVPVLRLLPRDTVSWLGISPYVAVGLYALDRLGVAAVADPGIYRLFLLLLNLLALGLTFWMLRQPWAAAGASGGALQWARRPLGWSVGVTLAVAVICNVTGNLSLAETLTSGVIDSGYMALLLYAGVIACQGLLGAVLNQPEQGNSTLVHRQGPVLQAACERLLVLGATIGWLLYSLDRFRLLRPLHRTGATVLGAGIDVGEVSVHLGDVLVFAVSTWLAVWIAQAVRRLLREELPGHGRLPRGVGNSIASLSYYAVLLLGLLVALSAAGFKVSQLMFVFGALGVGIGFGLQNVVNNFVSGVVLMFERPIQPGDVVDAAGISGTVRDIRLRATTIRTGDGADAVVPNGLLLSGNLTNWTMYDRSRRFEVTVGVAYGADPAQVIDILTAATVATAGVALEPEPVVLLTAYGDSALTFSIRAWTADLGRWMHVRGDLLSQVLAALDAAGIAIPYQQIDINLRHPSGELHV